MGNEGITAEQLKAHLDKTSKAIKEDANTPDAIWMPKSHLRVLIAEGLNIDPQLKAIVEDDSIPNNAIIQVLKQPDGSFNSERVPDGVGLAAFLADDDPKLA